MASRLRALSVVCPALLALSGLLLIGAARERWAGACPFWGNHETGACLARQDHVYDFVAPNAPWLPLGDAATLAGAAFLALAVAAAGVPALMLGVDHPAPRARYRTAFLALCAAVLSVGVLGIGWGTLVSARAGRALELWSAPVYGFLWTIGWPTVLVTLAAVAGARGAGGDGWRWTAVLLLAASTPFGLVFSGPVLVGYMSHDTAPWTEASAGILLVLAAPVLWRAGVVGRRSAPVGGDPGATAAPVSPGARG